MTDYDLLYTKFQFKDNDLERLNDLHKFAKACDEYNERFVLTTTVTNSTGVKVSKQEVEDVKLV